ncbi:3'-5' ssDNA/RNA exonuclease TatD [Elysia marginata]|uniref:3'-5' ssDNA/RNA exonuclease TatD n=1 Tax=Elysia marginata TaxID=1093978 RepID=A0AAV4J2Z2_9GAST|nr:3'-5' ssDNA/RNA exonuclease TatD [Elysia marginata]
MSLECQCDHDLGVNGQVTDYGSRNGFSSVSSQDVRVKLNLSQRQSPTSRTPEQYVTPRATSFSSLSQRDWANQLRARSQSYSCGFIDTHCHIDFLYKRMGVPYTTQYKKFMANHVHSYPDNYEGCVAVFCNPRTFNWHNPQDDILNLVSNENGVWLAIGCHPKSATEFGLSHEKGLRNRLSHPKVVALGEIGLDYSAKSFGFNADIQKKVLITQLKLAVEFKLPLVIHCRDADDDCIHIMTQYVPRHHKIHLHCFSRDPVTAQRWMDAFPNIFFGFTPVITYSSSWEPPLSAAQIPLDRVLLETDAPYFVPGQIKDVSESVHIIFVLLFSVRFC